MPDLERIDIKNIQLFGRQLSTLKQDFFDANHPIGEVYTQYPQQDDPMTLYNKNGIQSVWEEQLQYNGAFFRSSNALTIVWKVDGESNYYAIDNNNKITPVKVKADKGGGINIASSTSGHTKNIGGKIYRDYAVTGYSTAASGYINKTDNLNIQGNATKKNGLSATFSGTEATISVSGASHSHDSYTGYTQPTFTGTTVTSGTNSRDHTHTINNGNTSTSGTTTTVGFRGIPVTSGNNNRGHTHTRGTMNITGYFRAMIDRNRYGDTPADEVVFTSEEHGSDGEDTGYDFKNFQFNFDASKNWTGSTSDESQKHTHSVTASGYLYGKTDGESQNHTHDVTPKGTVQNHRHTISSSGTLSMSGDYTPAGSVTVGAGDSETRPDNYSYVIWKRIA